MEDFYFRFIINFLICGFLFGEIKKEKEKIVFKFFLEYCLFLIVVYFYVIYLINVFFIFMSVVCFIK